MIYTVDIDVVAHAEIMEFARYAANYSEAFASEQFEQFERLNRVLNVDLAQSPNMWAAFYVTGLPYRGYLFRVGRRTAFWIVYTVDEPANRVKVLRLWNASQNPLAFGVNFDTDAP